MIYALVISGFLYLIFNELEDKCWSSTWKWLPNYFNKNVSWKNKWKYVDGERIPIEGKKWYYLWFFTPKYKERFYLSTTLFVFVTDGEHLMQFLKNISIIGGFFAVHWTMAMWWVIGKIIAQILKELIPNLN